MLIMQQSYGMGSNATAARCAIHGVGLIGDGTGAYDIVLAQGKSDLIDGHSYLSGGCYNVNTQSPGANLEIYDSSLNNSFSDNATIGSPNVKIARNSFAGAGTGYVDGTTNYCYGGVGSVAATANNITFTGSDVVIADNIIQQARGWGIVANGARLMRITGNYFDNNGKGQTSPAPTGAIDIKDSGEIAITGNTFQRSGAAAATAVPPQISSHVYFEGTDDSISLSGNVYKPGLTSGDNSPNASPLAIRPDYNYDADKNAVLTNIVLADNPAPQNMGVLSPNAAALLAPSITPQYARNYLSGLVLSNNSGTATAVDIAAGEATDSTGITILKNPGCTVDLGASTGGLGKLDVNGGAAPSTTYYFFVVSGASGAAPNLINSSPKPSCMASASLTPSFANVPAYSILTNGYVTGGSTIAFRVGPSSADVSGNVLNPLAGMEVGDVVSDTAGGTVIPAGTKIAALNAFYASKQIMGFSGTEVDFSGALPAGIAPNMLASGNPNGQFKVQSGTMVTAVCGGSSSASCNPSTASCSNYPCVILSLPPSASSCSPTPCILNFGGNFTVTLDHNILGSSSATNSISFTVYNGLYRLVGALYTNSASTVVPFAQDGDTFTLRKPVSDINTTIATAPVMLALASVPGGISVEGLGRCIGGNAHIVLSRVSSTYGTAANFPTSPGYDMHSSTAQTAFSFRLYTNNSKQILAAADAGSTTLQCMTDGWVLRRGQ